MSRPAFKGRPLYSVSGKVNPLYDTVTTRRCHSRHINGPLLPMDAPSEPISPLVWLFLAAVASPFIAALAGAIA